MAPSSYQHLSQRAEAQAEAGNWDAARANWLEALSLAPDPAATMLELSYVESLAGHYLKARAWVMRAANAEPGSAMALLSLTHRLRTFNEIPVLRGIITRLLEDGSTPVATLVECARQLSGLNDFDLAQRCAQAALAKEPDDLVARLVRAQLLAHHGRIDAAALDIQWVLQRQQGIPAAWWMLSRLHKQTPESNHVKHLQAFLATPGLHADHVPTLARALHKELDDIGSHDAAWQALERLCHARSSTAQYDRVEHRRLVDALVAWQPRSLQARRQSMAGKTPVFVVGMHRSGTTLLEQLLSASPQLIGLGELNDFTSAMRYQTDHYCKGSIDLGIVQRAKGIDFASVGQRYLDGVAWRLGDEPFFVDKQPANFLNLGFICQALPEARILHMVRDPVETCFSNLRELFTEINPHSYDQHDLADYYLQYRRLMAHWHAAFPGRILDVDYARLTADPEATMRDVSRFCGIDYIDGMRETTSSTRAVATASSIQVREGAQRREKPKWAPYAKHLQPLIAALRQGGVEIPELPA